jgi:hypothetical protein
MLVRRRTWPVSAVLIVLALALPVPGAGPPKGAKPAIRAELRFSVKEFDPKKAGKGLLECVVYNDTGSPIKVPTRYARKFDSDIVVFGHGAASFRWEMRLVLFSAPPVVMQTQQGVTTRARLSEPFGALLRPRRNQPNTKGL